MEGTKCTSSLEEAALEELLEVFGSQFSLEDIASAYYEAKGNLTIAGEILYATHDGRASNGEADAFEDRSLGVSTVSLELSSEWESASAASSEHKYGYHNAEAIKSKKGSVSMGSISGVIGKDYVQPRPLRKDSPKTAKPVKIDSKDLPASVIWSEEGAASATANGHTDVDLEEFLFKMLGDGFQLDKSIIHEVLDSCCYDVKKSMDKLLDLSAPTLEKSDEVVGIAAEKFTEKCSTDQLFSVQDKPQCKDLAESKEATISMTRNRATPRRNKDRGALEKEVLEALFTVPERSEEAPKKAGLVRLLRRRNAYGDLVTEPLKIVDTSLTATVAELKKVSKDVVEDGPDDEENNYELLRQAVKEYLVTMKEYFKAAAEAFADGDEARANKLMDMGHFFNKKAREADEKSSEKIFETRHDEILSLDLRMFDPKEALNLLRVHLTSVSGIPSIKYLRIIVGTIEEDTKKGARKRLIMKQLEKESIKWTEEENGSAISIRVDIINPKCLSFAKNKN